MHATRNLLLAAIAALAAAAFLATSAFAQSVEVVDETAESHCGDVTEETAHDVSSGCEVRILNVTPTTTTGHVASGEVVTSSCANNFVANINEDGTGYIDVDANTVVENEAGGCGLESCDEAEDGTTPHASLEWPIAGIAEYGLSREAMTLTMCLRNHIQTEGAGSQPCTLGIDIVQTGHQQDLTANEQPCMENPAVELTGHWVTDDEEDEMVINHVQYPGDNP